jgi:hypothetical protein
MLKVLKMSRTAKIKAGWSREIGAGFINDDIEAVAIKEGKFQTIFIIKFSWGSQSELSVNELNLRETEELIKWVLQKETEERINKMELQRVKP